MNQTCLSYYDIAQRLQAKCTADGVFEGNLSIDSRTLVPGDLFVAIKGPHYDGHDYIMQAVERGASALMLEKKCDALLPQIHVADTHAALGGLAAYWREQFAIPVIAVTGSNGKTTVKEMIAAILSIKGPTLSTQGNLNNDIGVPLTLLRLRKQHQFAVIEMGANHPGEIRYLSKLAQPNIALITNAAAAHLEGFINIDGVAKAKGEIYESLKSSDTAIINHDDRFADFWHLLNRDCRQLSFSLAKDPSANIYGEFEGHGQLLLKTNSAETRISLKLPGEHNARNALAAVAVTTALGLDLQAVKQGLESMRAVKGRLELHASSAGINILDDTYNANPSSLQAALQVLTGMPGEAWLVLGDMGELGESSERLHYEMGELAREQGVGRLFTLGGLAMAAAEGFGEGAEVFNQVEELVDVVLAGLHKGVNILVKGSRAMRMERVVAKLQAAGDTQGACQSSQRYH